MRILPNFFRTNLSAYAGFLSSLSVGALTGDNLVSMAALMSNEDPKDGYGLWSSNETDIDSGYSLIGAEIGYAGPNSTTLPTNPLYTHVVCVKLDMSMDQGRCVYLHYNG